MAETVKIALAWPAAWEAVNLYQTWVSPRCKIVAPKGAEIQELIEVANDAEIIVGGYVPASMIANAPKLKMVQVTHAGAIAGNALELDLDQAYLGFSLRMLKERGILMGNIHGNSVLVAEHAITFMLVLAKRMIDADRAVSNGEWFPFIEDNRSLTIKGSVIAIVGLGFIGRAVTKRVKPFEAKIFAIKRTPAPELVEELGLEFLGGPADLPQVLRQADFVILTVPLTRETHHLIGAEELRLMKKSAYLINVARAELVEEEAIYRALTEKWIAGYASDVWWFYDCKPKSQGFLNIGYFCPVPSRLGVHRLPNVVATGDRACFTNTMEDDYIKDALQNADMLARGERPKNLVDLDDLY